MFNNVGAPNFSPTYHKMSTDEYKKMSFAPAKSILEEERKQATLQDQQQGKHWADHAARSMADLDPEQDPLSTKANSLQSRSDYQRTRLSGTFNAPTYVEISRHNEAKDTRGFRDTIKRWTKKGPPPAVA